MILFILQGNPRDSVTNYICFLNAGGRFLAVLPKLFCNTGALIVRLGFWGSTYYIYNKEPPK